MKSKLRKILAITSICCVSVAALIALALLFKIVTEATIITPILLTVLTVFLLSIFGVNCVDAIAQKSIFGYISGCLLAISGCMFIVLIWLNYFNGELALDTFLKICVIVSCISVFFAVFVGKRLALRNRYLTIQIIAYSTLGWILFEVCSLVIFTKTILPYTFIGAVAIISIVMFIILRVKAKMDHEEEKITIPLSEYNDLHSKVALYKARIEELEKKLRSEN